MRESKRRGIPELYSGTFRTAPVAESYVHSSPMFPGRPPHSQATPIPPPPGVPWGAPPPGNISHPGITQPGNQLPYPRPPGGPRELPPGVFPPLPPPPPPGWRPQPFQANSSGCTFPSTLPPPPPPPFLPFQNLPQGRGIFPPPPAPAPQATLHPPGTSPSAIPGPSTVPSKTFPNSNGGRFTLNNEQISYPGAVLSQRTTAEHATFQPLNSHYAPASRAPASSRPPSQDQIWVNSWLKDHAPHPPGTDSKVRVVVSDVCRRTLEAENWLAELRNVATTLKDAALKLTDAEREELAQKSKTLMERLKSTLDPISEERFLWRLKRKVAKADRHRRWKKKRIKKLQAIRDERLRRREQMHKEQDEWRLAWITEEKERREEEERKKIAQRSVQENQAKGKKHKDLVLLLEKLQKLRDLRREKRKRSGHFFPEEDDEFFNMVARMNDAFEAEQSALDTVNRATDDTEKETSKKEAMERLGIVGDPVREYWQQADFNLQNLIAIRKQWDAYAVPRGKIGSTCIPPCWVDPAPPGNNVWASYLVSVPPKITDSDDSSDSES